jgi:hypothetical protein
LQNGDGGTSPGILPPGHNILNTFYYNLISCRTAEKVGVEGKIVLKLQTFHRAHDKGQ